MRREVISRAAELIRGRVPLLVGITDTSVCRIGGASPSMRRKRVPRQWSFRHHTTFRRTDELVTYIRNIVAELPLPLMLYNMPSLTKVWFDFESLQKLTDLERIVGIKDSSGDLDYFGRLMNLRDLRPDWSIMIGPEALLPEAMRLWLRWRCVRRGQYIAAVVRRFLPGVCPRAISRGSRNSPRISISCSASTTSASTRRGLSRRLSARRRCWGCAMILWPSRFIAFHPPDRERVRVILEPFVVRLHGVIR